MRRINKTRVKEEAGDENNDVMVEPICAKGSIANEAVSCWGMIATEEYY